MNLKNSIFIYVFCAVFFVLMSADCEKRTDLLIKGSVELEPCFEFEQHGAKLTFTTQCTEGVPKTILWDFGDRHTVPGDTSPVHLYENPGTYQVVLEVTNKYDEVFTFTQSITVEEICFDCICKSRHYIADYKKKGCGTLQYVLQQEKATRDWCNRISLLSPAVCL